ncbi:MAG: N-acetyl-gamma-glutamyl-phosphate reductase [Nitrospinae bacterium]|nr:N-acetyl-gamma-glutamyl-phosphate reductase [Nitrospinota bacterium]
MVRIGIAGATGYTGLELVRLLLRHPEAEIVALTSETYQGKSVAETFPSLKGFCDLRLQPLDPRMADACDVVFLCLPHTAAMSQIPELLKRPARVIDLSADFRLRDAEVFEQWYHARHEHPELLGKAVYGLPELYRERIRSARFVANPGCYPTSVILALAPLMRTGWIDLDSIIADSKSGVSGAGRKAALSGQFSECNEGVAAYSVATHRHTPEIEQELSALAGRAIRVSFTPHLVPMTRGILSAVYANLTRDLTLEELVDHYRQHYRNEPFVRVLDQGTFASTRFVAGSNYCDIGLQVDPRTRRVVVTSAIDNLVKGASGQAVQNMNLMLGFEENVALNAPGIFP